MVIGRNNKQPALKVEITNVVTGVTRTVDTQEEIVATTAKSNLQRQSFQTAGTTFQ